jgi:type VI secretion system protein ImpL
MALFVVGIMLVTSLGAYVSFEYAKKQDAYYKKMISSYELSLKRQKSDVENPETTIASLHILHLFREDLISEISGKPWYVGESFLRSNWDGHQSRLKQFDAFYEKQLSLGLVPAIVRYLQGEMFVYLETNQHLQLINSKRVYDDFCSDDAASEAAVTAYLDESLSQSGTLSVGHRAQFLRLMSDSYELDFNAVPSCGYREKELMPLVEKELESVNKRPLLYAYNESRPE